jgi:hypothetical protein
VDLSLGSNASLMQIVGAITMEACVRPTLPQLTSSGSGGEYGLILSKGYDLSEDVDNIDLDIRSDNNEKSYLYWGGVYTSFNNLDQQSATGGYEANTNWTHVVASWDFLGPQTTNVPANGLWSLYVNGVLVAANEAVGPSLYAGPPYLEGYAFTDGWAIGNGTADGGALNWREFSGNICQVALYTNALTAAQVLTHYNLGLYGTNTTTTLPTLSVARGAPGSVVVSWASSVSTSYGLQQSATITGPWSSVTNAPVLVNSLFQVTTSPGTRNAFYRLKLQ